MEIFTAKSAGFCFGVKRAVDFVYKKTAEKKICTYGPIIHNKNIIDDLEKKGVMVIESLENIPDAEVVIRSHGVGEDVYRELEKKNIPYHDCTCPFVKKIHNIVQSSYRDGKNIIIIGNPEHPEVIGINGWCSNSAVILNSSADAENFEPVDGKYVLVVQTTFNKTVFEEIKTLLCDKADIEVFNTICSATSDRQQETIKLSKNVDVMIVLGDKRSSNTQKLYNISREINPNTLFCETADDLDMSVLEKNFKIGITAGASTPPAIIKEVLLKMSENNENFAEMLDASLKVLRLGDVVKGKVLEVKENEVYVNIDYKAEGIISKAEFSSDPNVVLANEVKKDDEIEVLVLKINDGEGSVVLSKKRITESKSLEAIEEAFNNKTTLKGKVLKVVKGGFSVLINDNHAFVPSSQISNRFVDDLKSFVGQEFDFNIIDFDKNGRHSRAKIVAGRKDLLQKELDDKKAEAINALSVGQKIEGTVSRITNFGAFIDLGGVDGLVHISEISWSRVKNVSDVLSVGDKVTAIVLDINAEKGKISLSLKDKDNNPWNSADKKYAIGSVIEGKVVRMVAFGAFVELEPGVDGLVHISQISNKRIEKPDDVLEVGQTVSVKVTDVDMENKKISLSIRDAVKAEEE